MNELFKFAMCVDVWILFYLFIGVSFYCTMSISFDVIKLIQDSWKQRKEKKALKSEENKENK